MSYSKNEMIKFVKSIGGEALYQGTWLATLYVQHRWRGKDFVIDSLIKKFGRHTQIRFQ